MMVCDHCKQRQATMYMKQTVNGKTTEYHLCAECAAEQGMAAAFDPFGTDLGDFWSSLFSEPAHRLQADTLRCKGCGRSFRQIVESGRPGCPTCYNTFYNRLLPSIQKIHGKSKHTGKVAQQTDDRSKKQRELQELQEQLNTCVANQEYEKCAELRDRIRALTQGGETV